MHAVPHNNVSTTSVPVEQEASILKLKRILVKICEGHDISQDLNGINSIINALSAEDWRSLMSSYLLEPNIEDEYPGKSVYQYIIDFEASHRQRLSQDGFTTGPSGDVVNFMSYLYYTLMSKSRVLSAVDENINRFIWRGSKLYRGYASMVSSAKALVVNTATLTVSSHLGVNPQNILSTVQEAVGSASSVARRLSSGLSSVQLPPAVISEAKQCSRAVVAFGLHRVQQYVVPLEGISSYVAFTGWFYVTPRLPDAAIYGVSTVKPYAARSAQCLSHCAMPIISRAPAKISQFCQSLSSTGVSGLTFIHDTLFPQDPNAVRIVHTHVD